VGVYVRIEQSRSECFAKPLAKKVHLPSQLLIEQN
jgi:hypothetical protein